jgi:SsrA-binding protein
MRRDACHGWPGNFALGLVCYNRCVEIKTVATNRKANFEYFLLEKYEAGLALKGTEIKSIRAGQISLAESYVLIEKGQAWLIDAHIAPYNPASRNNHDPRRPRRLLLHKKELRKMTGEVNQRGVTVVPTRVYIKEGRAKIEIALARGKKLYDKRDAIARRDAEREQARGFRDK